MNTQPAAGSQLPAGSQPRRQPAAASAPRRGRGGSGGGPSSQLPGLLGDVMSACQVAGVVERDLPGRPFTHFQFSLFDERGKVLAMMQNLVMATKLRIVVDQAVQTVGAVRDDLALR